MTLHRDAPLQSGYCTNVHAGRDLAGVLANLREHSAKVRSRIHEANSTGTSLLGVGLWFSELSAAEALQPDNLLLLQRTLEELGLLPYTLNGFPQGDFHQRVVKHQVYLPTWWDRSRFQYTSNLVKLLDAILPPGAPGSISTLPIAWSEPHPSDEELSKVCEHWLAISRLLSSLREKSGRTIVLAIEPEPGCFLTDSQSFRDFYLNRFITSLHSEEDRRIAFEHITLCHDVCHAAVMYEDQSYELQQSMNAGIKVGKVQVSSAISVDWSKLNDQDRGAAWNQLASFAEDRYLHQTNIVSTRKKGLIHDLPHAIAVQEGVAPTDGTWRIHFHVPIYLSDFGALRSTQSEIEKCLEVLLPKVGSSFFPTGHFEVETYAWPVLPKELQVNELSEGIYRELDWFDSELARFDA